MDEFEESYDDDGDQDYYGAEEEANGHDADEEDLEEVEREKGLYEDENELEKDAEEEFEEGGILGLEQEYEDTVDEFPSSVKKVEKEKKNPKIVSLADRITHSIMTKFEYSRFISARAQMISNGSARMVYDTKYIHAIDIAKEETVLGVNPLSIERILPNGNIEIWKCSELRPPKSYI